MSTAYTSAKKQFIGNGSATEFGFDFPYKAESEIKVYLKRGDANEVVLTKGTDYSFVSENTIKFPASGSSQTILTSSDVLAIQRESEFESPYDFSNQQRLEPEEVMHSDDNLERQVQELKRDVDSSVKVAPTSLISPTGLTEHIERVYASTDNIDIVAGSIASVNTNAANVEDINTVAGSIDNVNTVADNIGSVNKVAAIDVKVSAVADNETNVNTVAGSIDNVNTVAGISESVSVVAGISEDVEQVAMIKDQTAAVGENISDVMTVADINTQVSTVAANVEGVKDVGDNINAVLQAPTHAENARKWAEGTDAEITPLGGVHSAKGWAEQAAAIARLDDASETVKGIIRIANADEAEGGTMDTVAMTPLKTKYVADDYTGKGLQLGFNGTLEGSVLTFNPDESSYVLKQGYDYELDLLFPAVGVLPNNTQIVIKNGSDTIQVVNVRHADASTPITYGDMKQICRYDTNIGWRWVFNARYAVTDTGVKVFVMPSFAFQDDRYVTTDTAQNIIAGKNFVNDTSSTNIDAHTNMSICLKNEQAELGANTLNADGTVNFKYQGIRTVDKNNEEVSYLYSAPDGVGGSFTRLGASTKVNGEYADAFLDIEVDANGKGHLYIPDVDTDSTVSGNQAATKEYVDDSIYKNVTNCITEIPQDIKLELKDGVLTLKAGSKLWYPDGLNEDGSKKFSSVITARDLTVPNNPYDVRTFIFYNIENNGLTPIYTEQCYSGETEPSTSSVQSRYYWFDIANNLIKTKLGSETAWGGKYSFPLVAAMSSVSNGYKSIDQVFNGFGYIGSTVYVLPGVKAIAPNGRNADGSLKNTQITIDGVEMNTFASETYGEFDLCLNNLGYLNHYAHKTLNLTENNLFEYEGAVFANRTKVGTFRVNSSADNGRIAWLTTQQPFKTVDYNDGTFLSAQSMPSSKYINLTLGASGTTYTAPANGWFSINGTDNGVLGTYNIVLRCASPTSGRQFGVTSECNNRSAAWSACILPCKRGDTVYLFYSSNITANSHIWRFYYAEGEV